MNAHHDEIPFTLPGEAAVRWNALIDTSAADGTPAQDFFQAGTAYPLQGRSAGAAAFQKRTMKRRHDMPFGAAVIAPDLVRFRLWAPAAGTVELCLEAGR